MRAYAEMKSAESVWLDEVPAHWTVSRFRYEATISGGQVDPREDPWRNMTLIAPNHIESNTGRVISSESAEVQGADSGKYLVERGQLIYSKIRPALNKAAIAETDALCSADMYAVSFGEQIEPRFALYFVLARPFHTFATVASLRVKMPKVNREELADVPWLVPPMDEQRAIADFLDRETARIDTLIEEQKVLIRLLSERKNAAIGDPFESVGRLAPLGSVLDELIDHRGKTPGKVGEKGDDFTSEGVPVVSAIHIKGGRIAWAERERYVPHWMFEKWMPVRLRAGDVLLTSEAPLGNVAQVSNHEPLVLSQRLFALRGRQGILDSTYLRYFLESNRGQELLRSGSSGSTVAGIRQSRLVQLSVPTPPMEEQVRTAHHIREEVTKIDQLVVESEKFIELSRERRSALITAAVTGQIDVREVA